MTPFRTCWVQTQATRLENEHSIELESLLVLHAFLNEQINVTNATLIITLKLLYGFESFEDLPKVSLMDWSKNSTPH